jgi:glycosyltransferase involved in cell wall biosynthesis
MHVGLNLIYLVPGETGGMETYARELIPALLNERPDLRLTAFINREATEVKEGPWHDLVPSVTVRVRARRRIEWVRGEQQLLPRLAAREGIHLLHSLASTAPAWGAFRRVVTINDVIYRVYPEAHFGVRSLAMGVLIPLAARRSHRVIAPSSNTRDDLVRLLNVPPEKVDVVPDGVGTTASARPLSEDETRKRYDLGTRSVALTLSAKRPHKNLARLLDALALIPRERRPVLVLPGYATPHEAELQRQVAALGLDPYVRLIGWVSAEEVESLYQCATCFVFPSLYEGFGLPVLEAMARGVPVACSNRGSLAEVAGNAARLFDPERPQAIADAIEALLRDHDEAARLRDAGLERAKHFTWKATARETLASYERAMASGKAPKRWRTST